MGRVVVGVDGSEAATAALEYAVQEAALRNATLRVVSAWELPVIPAPPGTVVPQIADDYPNQADAIVADAVKRAQELRPDVAAEGAVVQGYAGDILVKEGKGAELLVLGKRGLGGLAGLLLGSVSRYVADRAPCPLTIVPPPTKK